MPESEFILLDGGMGRELQCRGLASVSAIWSAEALVARPDVVREIHTTFIDAGAEIITTNNYAVVPFMLAREGIEERRAELLAAALRLACEARDAADRPVRVAGSLPPLNHSYRPELVGPAEEIEPLYREIAGVLAPGVDLFVCETMASAAEARSAARAAAAFEKPVWVAWTLDDAANGRLRSGESMAEALAALDGLPVDAVLFNCCTPESISVALPELRGLTDKAVGGYANALTAFAAGYEIGSGGETPAREDIDPAAYARFAGDWRVAGADIIGGCCGIGPAHIAELRRVLV